MIKFFRRTRRKLLGRNQMGKYLLYALGEIILVVIGILIALYIDNQNEIKKQEQLIAGALKQVHKELAMSIREADQVIDFCRQKDAIINLVLNDKVTADDYRSNSPAFKYLIVNRLTLNILDNGFSNLQQYINNTPIAYEKIIEELKTVFVTDKNRIEAHNQKMGQIVDAILGEQRDHKDWFAKDYYFGQISEAGIQYFLTDNHYKNQVQNYFIEGVSNHYPMIFEFRKRALKNYRALTSLLNLESETGQMLANSKELPQAFAHFLGTYQDDTTVIKIYEGQDQLLCQRDGAPVEELFPLSPNSFLLSNSLVFNSFEMDTLGQIIRLQRHFGKDQRFYEKVK